ncbi:MAG: tetratricopeptide repeat protein [Hyphomicrobiaceae bacterium]|nr:tetratricopeptide repeat protein [Hyphomicrobiaceae bacterium]
MSGNCQANELKSILYRGDFGGPVSIKWNKAFDNDFFPGDKVTREDYASCDLLLVQAGSWSGDDPAHTGVPPGCPIVLFPAVGLDAAWPLGFRDPRNKACRITGYEPYPFGAADRIAYNLVKDGVDVEDIVEHYHSIDITSVCDYERALEIFDAKAQDIDEKCPGVEMSSFISDNFRGTRLFLTRNHPTGTTMAHLLGKIIDVSPLGEWLENAEFLVGTTARSRGIGEFEDPVNPQVAAGLGLTWVTPQTQYAYYHEGSFDFDERLKRYASFRYNEHLLLLRREMQTGKLGESALMLALKALTYDPNSWYMHYVLSLIYRMVGNQDDAQRSLKHATRLAPGSWVPHHGLADLHMKQGHLDRAVEIQAIAVGLNPDKAAVHFQMGLIRERLGDLAEALDSYIMALRLEPNNATVQAAVKRLG